MTSNTTPLPPPPQLFPGASRLTKTDEDFCHELLAGVFGTVRGRFPGSMPVPLLRENMDSLRREVYLVSRKSDGERAILILCKTRDGRQIHALMDRKMHAWDFPVAASEIAFERGLVADCEVIVNGEVEKKASEEMGEKEEKEEMGGGKVDMSLVVFEVAWYFGISMTKANMSKRVELAERLVGKVPGKEASFVLEEAILENGGIVSRCGDAVLHAKKWVPVKDTRSLWSTDIMPAGGKGDLSGPVPPDDTDLPQDGLIFMPEDGPMPVGTARNVFKHKPAHTVDLMFECEERDEECQLRLLCMMNGQMLDTCAGIQYKGTMLRFRPHTTPEFAVMIDRVMGMESQKAILECELRLDGDVVHCLPKRLRDDKMRGKNPRPNDYRTIIGALAATEDPIGLEEIIELVGGR